MLSRFSGRITGCLLTAGALVLTFAAPAAAHVTVQPEEAVQGGYAKLTFRVPNESDTAGTVRLRVELPSDTPFPSVRTRPVPGWQAETETTTFDEPVSVGDVDVEEAVTAITWTAQRGVRIDPGEFEEFEISVGPLPETTDSLAFPAIQTYSDDSVVRWDETSENGGEEPEHPAPALTLTPAVDEDTGSADDDAGDGAGDDAEDTGEAAEGERGQADGSASDQAVDSTARTLGAAGLAVGVLSLAALALVVVRARRGGHGEAEG